MRAHRGTVRRLWGASIAGGESLWEFRCGLTHYCRVRKVTERGWADAVAFALIHFWASEPDGSECTYSRAYASVGWSG